MTLKEFEAWFEGFIENLNGLPNREEWERILLEDQECRRRAYDGNGFHRPVLGASWTTVGLPGSLVFFGRRNSTKRSAH